MRDPHSEQVGAFSTAAAARNGSFCCGSGSVGANWVATPFGEGLVGALSPAAAGLLRKMVGGGILAREVPLEEVRRMAPHLSSWLAAFETVPNTTVSASDGPAIAPGNGDGIHGLWPTRKDYRASFLLWGPGIKPQRWGEISNA